MKRKLLFIILCVTTLTFIACGKMETPVMSNSVETETIEEETEPIIENEPITESETETITTDEITETISETDTTIEVDISGVDGAVEEGDYDEELHGENAASTENSDEFQEMLKEMAEEIYSSNDNEIIIDQSVLEEFGATPDSGVVANDVDYSAPSNPQYAGGSLD